jgi:tetratricopeptide (TPR) repeat protein
MAPGSWKLMIAAACILALASGPAVGQDPGKDKELTLCVDVNKNAATRLEACTRILDRERDETKRRQAVILIYRALALKADGKLDGATAALAEAIEVDPNFATAYAARGDIQRDRGQCDQAITDYDRVIQLAPKRAVTYVYLGSCWLQKREFDRAMKNLEEAIRLDPNNAAQAAAPAWAMKGRLQYLKGDVDGAVNSYDHAIKLDPNNAAFHIERAAALSNKQDSDHALSDLEQAIKFDANNGRGIAALAWSMKAGLRFANGDADGALADYSQAIQLDANQADLYFSRGIVWHSKRDFGHAVADFTQAVKLDQSNAGGIAAPAWDWKGRDQLLQGDVDGAIAAYAEAIRINPKFAAAYQDRGDVFKERGDYARAVENYDQAIDLGLTDPPVYGGRGLMQFYLGDFAKAAADLTFATQAQTDAYSLLLLYLSIARGGQDGKDALTRGASRLKSKDWPYPIVELFLGQRSLDAVRAAASTSDQQCELQYYAGEWQLLAGKREPAHAALQAAVDSCPKDFVEYRAAVAELKRWSP